MSKLYGFFFLLLAIIPNENLQAQAGDCACTNCPQFMQDLFVGDFIMNVQGATNNTLGQNGQGVCGVHVTWDHTAICDISITLTAPSGQSVTLVGPIGQFCTNMGNLGTTWDVTFLPCADAASPDFGFSAQWNSNQNWGANNNYSGSYYPFNGCLENLTGPVNGDWVLTVNDAQLNDTGNLLNFEVIFCDPSGINCVSCEADAGALLQGDVAACEGTPPLALDLPPSYAPPAVQPPASDYSYTYVIAGLGGVIQAITSDPDMTGYTPGTYTVCGLSYFNGHLNLLPMPNGSLTIAQLTTQLNSSTPPFCGAITSNCVNVTIFPTPPDEEEYAEVCAPNCYEFLGQFYCQTGDYTVVQTNSQGCPYNAILHLTVNQPPLQNVTEVICAGECSAHPEFPDACTAGNYQVTLENQLGCDSIITLNLTVVSAVANIQPPAAITCSQTSITLFGSGSSTGGSVSYQWTASNGGQLIGPTNQLTATATAAGTYQLLVCRTQAGVTCCDSTEVQVISNVVLPAVPVISGVSTTCEDSIHTFSVQPVSGATAYNWTVPSGVSILSGQGSTMLTVAWNTALGGNICVAAANNCGAGPDTCLAVAVVQTPDTPSVSGPLFVCQDSSTVYTLDSIPGAAIYLWEINGGTILSGDSTRTVTVVWSSSGSICASAANSCGESAQHCLNITMEAPPLAPAGITGDTLLCAGITGSYSIGALNNASSYTWSVPPGATILSGQNTTSIQVDWGNTSGGNVCVSGSNNCGNGGQTCLSVEITPQPIANAGADNSLCSLTDTLAATPSVSGSTGAWVTISGPGVVLFSNINSPNSQVSVSLPGIYSLSWQETVGNCFDVDTVTIHFFATPITGTVQHLCDNTNQNYTVTFTVSNGLAPYSSPGGTVTNGVFTSNLIPNGQSYNFVITDANGCSALPVAGVFNCNCATNAGQMSQVLLEACPGQTVTAAAPQGANLDADDTGAFYLHSNSGSVLGTVFDQNTTGTFGLTAGMTLETTYYISFVVGNNVNGLPDLSDPCLSVSPGQPVVFHAAPPTNAGADQSVCGLDLSLNGTPANGLAQWFTISNPPGGSLSFANAQNISTQVTASAFGLYEVGFSVTVNGCTATDTTSLAFNSNPGTGAVTHLCSPSNTDYTVSFSIIGGAQPFQVNGQPVSGTVFTSALLPTGSNYNFVVTDANGCMSVAVTGTFNCSCSTFAGTVNQTPVEVCQGDSITVAFTAGQVLDADDIAYFVLHTNPGASLGTVFAQNQTGVFQYVPGMLYGVTYYVSPIAGNNSGGFPDPLDPCLSITAGQPVVFLQAPVPNAGADLGACGLTAFLDANFGLYPGAWSFVSGPGTANIANPVSHNSSVSVSTLGTYIFRWTETNGNCPVSDEVEAEFWPNPTTGMVMETCNSTNTGYTISVAVSGGTAPYTVTGQAGTFSGNIFTSSEVPTGGSYNFTIRDANGCQAIPITGDHLCPCGTFAGTMDVTPAVFCADQAATAVYNNDAGLDADDGIVYILHSLAGNSIGTVYGTNSQPSFTFGAGLLPGTTYYISAVAGSLVGNTVNLNDPCLSVAAGTPVQWKALPNAFLLGDATICNGSSTVLNFNGTGSYPLQLTYSDGSGVDQNLTITHPLTIPVSVNPTQTTTYSLLSVTDGTLPACTTNLSESVTVTVNQPVNAGTADLPAAFCSGMGQLVDLTSLLSDEDGGGQWFETSAFPSGAGAFNATSGTFNAGVQLPGVYTFRYTVTAALPCPAQSAIATVLIHPAPTADAGNDFLINCHQDMATLGGSGTSSGADITYVWTNNDVEVGNTAQLQSGDGGTFQLEVTNAFGCTDTDEAVITLDEDIPMAENLAVQPVRCFGEANGTITVDQIQSNHPPVLIALNGGPFGLTTQFEDLEPGPYQITLQDANGCEWNSDTLVVLEPPMLQILIDEVITLNFGDSVSLSPQVTAPFNSLEAIVWKPLLDPIHPDTLYQVFLPFASLYVDLEVTDTNGCYAAERIKILVEKPEQVYIPNVIKPGSLTFNDIAVVYGGRGVAEIEQFLIFDRWGEQLFEAKSFLPNDRTQGWDGQFKGQVVLPGVYVYVVRVRFIDGSEKVYKGDITVVR